jgi:hypothetical protein
MNHDPKTRLVLTTLALVFLALAIAFLRELWGRPAPLAPIPLVDPVFTNTATVRTSLVELIRAKADLSDFDCYGCHEKNKPPPLRFDKEHNLIIPKEHENIVMGHGRHNRNNLCYNCHDEANLELLQTRDGRELKMADSTPLCGSCHGPTYRDWEAGVHGRTSGFWSPALGPAKREDCVACHNPHAPKIPSRPPAPGPHPLHSQGKMAATTPKSH